MRDCCRAVIKASSRSAGEAQCHESLPTTIPSRTSAEAGRFMGLSLDCPGGALGWRAACPPCSCAGTEVHPSGLIQYLHGCKLLLWKCLTCTHASNHSQACVYPLICQQAVSAAIIPVQETEITCTLRSAPPPPPGAEDNCHQHTIRTRRMLHLAEIQLKRTRLFKGSLERGFDVSCLML